MCGCILKDGGNDACKDPPAKTGQAQYYQNLVIFILSILFCKFVLQSSHANSG